MKRYFMLDIDLSLGISRTVDVTDLFSEYIGGTGVATALFADADQKSDPYDSEAPVIFAIGPFSSVFPVATKTVALFKSPLTGNLGESHTGGRLAAAMYGAGFHVIRIKGRCHRLSCVEIAGDKLKIHSAVSLKGMTTTAADRILHDKFPSKFKRSIIRIGPAGERLSPMASVMVDASRHFGRLGLGGVLGSKNVKALIISGGKYWTIDNAGDFNNYYSRLFDSVVKSDLMRKYHDLGTSMNVLPLSKINGLPTRNFSQGFFAEADRITGEAFAEKQLSQQISCAHCPCGCIHIATVRECFNKEDHMFKTFKVSYDHELIFAWGSNLSIGDPDEVLKLLQLVEKQGWDAISMGGVLAWAIEAFQKGFITANNTDELVLNFGDAELLKKMLFRIAVHHNEFYGYLEKGVIFCSEKYGGKEFAIAFGGNEAPGYMTGIHAYLGYAVGVRHSHLDAAGYSIDQKKLNSRKSDSEWTKAMYEEAIWRMVLNSLVICLFARNIYTCETIEEGLALLGAPTFDRTSLMLAARKIHAMKIKLKNDMGFDFDNLYLPARLERAVTTCGQVTSQAFREQVKLYKELAESDFELL